MKISNNQNCLAQNVSTWWGKSHTPRTKKIENRKSINLHLSLCYEIIIRQTTVSATKELLMTGESKKKLPSHSKHLTVVITQCLTLLRYLRWCGRFSRVLRFWIAKAPSRLGVQSKRRRGPRRERRECSPNRSNAPVELARRLHPSWLQHSLGFQHLLDYHRPLEPWTERLEPNCKSKLFPTYPTTETLDAW